MFKKLKNEIESKRDSKSKFWKSLVFAKDLAWKFSVFINDIICDLYRRINFYKYKRNKFPDIVIIGTQKSATIALWNNLNKHLDIRMVKNEYNGKIEMNFFNANYRKGKLWYKSHFKKDGRLWGEKTPEYIYKTKYHKRMYKTIPNAKLILCLRNPVTRAYSQWNMAVALFREGRRASPLYEYTFEKAIEKFEDVVGRGFYINQIKSLLRFYPREQIHILIFERLKKNMKEEYNKIWKFLGVKKFYLPSFEDEYNAKEYLKPMKKETEKRLYKLYKPYNKRLFDFLGYEIKEWESKE